jgi:transposase
MGITMAMFEDIQKKIANNLSDREIARALKKRRTLIAEIRKGDFKPAFDSRSPNWAEHIQWDEVLKEIGSKHTLKDIWFEVAEKLISYEQFTRYLHKRYPFLKREFVVPRDFKPGERAEVDWAGDTFPWIHPKTEKIENAQIFIGILGFSQLIFATARETQKKHDFFQSHRLMYEFFGGVPLVTAPDNCKTAVIKTHLYDPDLNPEYKEFAHHYGTAVVPARPYRPKDKALVEGAVKLVMRAMRWRYRRHTFTSLTEIQNALMQVTADMNAKKHTRFKVSRNDRFLEEKEQLKPLPEVPHESFIAKEATVHPDTTVQIDFQFYSVPHLLRGKRLRVKIFDHTIEIFNGMERVAIHEKLKGSRGKRLINPEHLPENGKAYREQMPQTVLWQAKNLSPALHEFIKKLFELDTCGNLRRSLGLIGAARKIVREYKPGGAEPVIEAAVAHMNRFNQTRVEVFKTALASCKQQNLFNGNIKEINRQPGNEMLRRTFTQTKQEKKDEYHH